MPSPGTQIVLELLRSSGDFGPSTEAKLDFLQSRRRNQEASRELDELFIAEIAAKSAAVKEAQATQEQLRARHEELARVIDQLRAPPLRIAVFLGWVETGGQVFARVAHGGERQLVRLAEGSECENLVLGDTVFLAHSLGVILGKSENGTKVGETATVERRLSMDRIILRDRDEEIVVQAAEALRNGSLESGDQVLWNRQLGLAFEKISTGDSSPHFLNIKEITEPPPPIGGLAANLKRVMSAFTTAVAWPELARRFRLHDFNLSALFVGPPGCGKTLVARTIAYLVTLKTGVACRFAVINGAQLESPWVGQTQANIRRLFKALNEYDGPTILFIDEVEAIGRHRGSLAGQHQDRFLSAWLTCLSGFQQRDRVAVIAASNRKDLIDPALLERVSGLEVRVGRPNREGAREIFNIYLPTDLPYRANGATPSETRQAVIDSAVSSLYDPNGDSAVATLRFRDGKSRTVVARELLSGRVIKQTCLDIRQRAFQRVAAAADAGKTTSWDIALEDEGIILSDMHSAVADTMEKLSTTISVRNAHHYLTDLSEDADVVAVEPIRRKVRRHRYLAS